MKLVSFRRIKMELKDIVENVLSSTKNEVVWSRKDCYSQGADRRY